MWRPVDSVPFTYRSMRLISEMSFAQVMHEEAHLLHSVRQVGASECQVLERAGETPVRVGVVDGSALRGR